MRHELRAPRFRLATNLIYISQTVISRQVEESNSTSHFDEMALKTILLLTLALFSGLFLAVWHDILPGKPEKPVVEKMWFGPGKRPSKESTEIKPFSINYKKEDLDDLKAKIQSDLFRLKSAQVAPLEDSGFEYGFNTDYLINDVASYWLKSFDWKKQEKNINNVMPQFKTKIDGLDIHFAHIKPDASKITGGKKVLPILMVHGWPGSFVEFLKIVPMLTKVDKNQDFVFEVIVPSIPGYGFSSASAKKGFDAIQTARIFVELMERLGHQKFYAQGGDWGSLVTSALTTLFPEKVLGLHLNMCPVNSPSSNLKYFVSAMFPSLFLTEKDQAKILPMGEKFKFLLKETGYMHIQGTKPDTVGLALTTSPLGLASYILEKFSTWTMKAGIEHNDGLLTKKFTLDELLTNIMIYWINGNIIPSQRYYKENFGSEVVMDLDRIPIENVPVACAAFPEEILNQPESFIKSRFKNLLAYSDMSAGGHFAAYEEPKLLYDDIVSFVGKTLKLKQNSKSEL